MSSRIETIEGVPTSNAYDFHHAALSADLMISASASTTPVFQTNPDKVNMVPVQSFQQPHQQLLQQQRPLQQSHLNPQQAHQSSALPTSDSQQGQLLTPAGSEYYSTDYTQYMSPMGVHADTSEAAMVVTDPFDDEE
ncbi:hypothetical protein BGW38_009973, partial [Lunasporangiospora selenospora]